MLRVLLFGLPALVEGMLRNGLSRDSSLALESLAASGSVAEVNERLVRSLPPDGPAVLVAREDAPRLNDHRTLLASHPRLHLVTLSADGRSAELRRGNRPPQLLRDLSMDALARTLRAIAAEES
jgi:hypothetical protein